MSRIARMGRRLTPGVILLATATGAAAQTLRFTDVSQAAGVDVFHTTADGETPLFVPGGAAGDFNRDGWQDLFIVRGNGAADSLFINNRDGTFTDQAAAWGVDARHVGSGVCVGDYDNDGWLDIFETSFGPRGTRPGRHKLYHNNAGVSFTDVAASAGVNFTSPADAPPDGYGASFGDYDLDGDLDLAVAGWHGFNVLFRNNGDGTFSDVTRAAIARRMRSVRGFSPHFADMDGDRYPELLWVADFASSKYLVNNRDGTFRDATGESGTGIENNGMGTAVGDFNNDGLLDWYATSIFSPTTFQTGNMLYLNQGGHRYVEAAHAGGVDDVGWAWGAVAVDLNHDGLLDLAVTNGYLGPFWQRPAKIFLNQGGAHFTEVAAAVGINYVGHGRGLLAVDYDNDGDEDLVFLGYELQVELHRNEIAGPDRNWLRVFLDTSARPDLAPDGIGARVIATVGDASQLRAIEAGTNFLSQSELSAHFGLGAAASVDELRVEWTNGKVTVLNDVAANQTLTIAARLDGDLDGDRDVDLTDLARLLASFSACAGQASYDPGADVDHSGCVDLLDLESLLIDFGLRR